MDGFINREKLHRSHKKCPVCIEYIYLGDSRSVSLHHLAPIVPPLADETTLVRMTLMKRAAGTTLALPKGPAYDSWANQLVPNGPPNKGGKGLPAFPPSVSNADTDIWSRVLLASDVDEFMMEVLKSELNDVEGVDDRDMWTKFCVAEIYVCDCQGSNT